MADEDKVGDIPGASRPVKHSFSINRHRTSISLEQAFWSALTETAKELGLPVAALVARIDGQRGHAGLSSAIRVWLLDRYRRGSEPDDE